LSNNASPRGLPEYVMSPTGSAAYEPKLLLAHLNCPNYNNKGKTATGILEFSPGFK